MEETPTPHQQQVEIIKGMVESIFGSVKEGVEDLKVFVLNECTVKPETINALFKALPLNHENHNTIEALNSISDFVIESNTRIKEKINAFQITPDEIEYLKKYIISKIDKAGIELEEMKFYEKLQEAAVAFVPAYVSAVKRNKELLQVIVDLVEASKTK